MYAMLPAAYAWLLAEPGPEILRAMLSLYGLAENPLEGASNPDVVRLAREAGVAGYDSDDTAWCGLAAAWAAWQAGFERPSKPLWALSWLQFGTAAVTPMLGDVMVFARDGGVHVGLYVGEDIGPDGGHWHILGGNQGDRVSVRRFAKSGGSLALKGVRRCAWRVAEPPNVRRVILADTGAAKEGPVT